MNVLISVEYQFSWFSWRGPSVNSSIYQSMEQNSVYLMEQKLCFHGLKTTQVGHLSPGNENW